MEIYVGCSGWYYWRWRGAFYPEGLPAKSWFAHYAQQFDTVELNAPFYHWPRDKTVEGWRRAAPAGFRYTVKVNRQITHERQLVNAKRLIRKFYGFAEILGPQFGCFLFQFPPSFRYTATRLKRVVRELDPAYRNVVEFRHSTWFRKNVFMAFARRGIIFCGVSAPRLPEEFPRAQTVYLRFHGRSRWYRHDYTDEELAVWVARIRASGAQEVWAYFNNDFNGNAARNAQALRRMLTGRATPVVR